MGRQRYLCIYEHFIIVRGECTCLNTHKKAPGYPEGLVLVYFVTFTKTVMLFPWYFTLSFVAIGVKLIQLKVECLFIRRLTKVNGK